MKPIYECCQLRPEVLQGDLQDAIFAADFGHVVEGIAPRVYQSPDEFFRNTHPAAALKSLVTRVFSCLADPNESSALFRLSTGFGGGKTHALIALWHLAKNISKPSLGTELLDAAGRPARVAVAAVDGNKAGTDVCLQHESFATHSLWGELAYQLGGDKGYAKVKDIDHPEKVPHAALIRDIMPADVPVLILLDELVLYMAKLSDRGSKALLSFIHSLPSEVSARRQAALIITDPTDNAAYGQEAREMSNAIEKAGQALDSVLSRTMTDLEPIGDESAQVIIRRLFTRVDRSGADEASSEYWNAYRLVLKEYPGMLPKEAEGADYAKRIVQCYPFHPRLLNTAKERLGALQDFQKSRGTLRLFGRILRDIWDRRPDISLITAGDINWASAGIQAELLHRLNRDSFKAAVDADVIRHAAELDEKCSTDIHRRVASALLLESLPTGDNAAMDKPDITLATLRPGEVGCEPGEAVDRLLSVCWHTYKNSAGDRFQFRYDANAYIFIEKALGRINIEDALSEVRTRVLDYFRGGTFDLKPYPQKPGDVQDSARLKLVLCDSEQLAQAVCDYEDDSDPAAKRPRRFRNAIAAIAPNASGLDDAVYAARRKKAAERVLEDYNDNEEIKKQVNAIMPTLSKRAQFSACRAFNRVFFQGRPPVSLDEKYLVADENVLQAASGQKNLKQFLDDARLVYQPTDSLDLDLLLDNIMKGSTPSLDHEGAYPASSIHERALASDKLRLMMDGSPVRNTILKGVESGKLVVRLENGDVHDSKGKVSGPEGNRKRIEDVRLSVLNLTSDVLVAPADAPCVAGWTATTQVQEPDETDGGDIRPPEQVTASTWEDAIEYARKRPLKSLILEVDRPDAAKTLSGLAQPFGAQSLSMTVLAKGDLKDGGNAAFKVEGVKHNNNLAPVDIASKLIRAMNDGAEFLTSLELDFGEAGRTGAAPTLENACENASEDVNIKARFGKEN